MIYIVIRKTVDWSDAPAVNAQLPDQMRIGVKLWNETFNIPYHLYRNEIKNIAEKNLAGIPDTVCVLPHEIPTGATVVPADDDDWFAPDLARAVERQIAGYSGCYWPCRFLETPISLPHQLGLLRRALFPHTPPRWLCITNNYAVVFGPDTSDLIKGHIRATKWFLAHPAAITRISQPLSLMNRTLASTTQLRSEPSKRLLLKKFKRYTKLYQKPVPPEMSWCEPYVSMMKELHTRLQPCRP